MWLYAAVFLLAVAVDSIPVFAPPAWPIMVLFLVYYDLNVWAVILLGVIGTTIGRFILSTYMPWIGHNLLNPWEEENLKFLGDRLSQSAGSAFVLVFLYSLTPLSTTALFTAAGIAKVPRLYLLPAFFLGKLISYSTLILTSQYLVCDADGILTGAMSWKSIVSGLVGLLLILGFMFIDWKELLLRKQFRLNFQIWKGKLFPRGGAAVVGDRNAPAGMTKLIQSKSIT